MTPESTNIELLLAHDGLLRRLAVRLAGESDADDAVQETWLAALRRGSLRAETARAWLGTVLGGVVRTARRTRRRASTREAAVARRDVAPSAFEIVERESMRREVVDALLALDPIYRDAVLLRYESDLPPRKVAAALGVPTETARTRIKRGLAVMRQRLDHRMGPERRRSFILLLPPAAAGLQRFVAAGSIAAALAIAVVLTRSSWIGAHTSPAATRPARGAAADPAKPEAAGVPIRTGAFSEPPLRIVGERESTDLFPCAEPRDASGAHRFVATRLIDELTGAPVPGAVLSIAGETSRWSAPATLRTARADADGWVRARVDDLREHPLGTFWHADRYAAGASSGAVPPFPIRLGRTGTVLVRVVDVAGAPVAGARLEPFVGAARWNVSASTTTDVGGLGRLAGPDPASAWVLVSAEGHQVEEASLVAHEPALPLEVTLRPARKCSGAVVRRGSPVAGARVSCAGSTEIAITGAAGGFLLRHAIAGGAIQVSERRADEPRSPELWMDPVAFAAPVAGRPCRLDLDVLEEPKTAVRLVCADANGAPVPGVPIAVTSADGRVTRLVSGEDGAATARVFPGVHDVATDDLDAAFEAVPASFVAADRDAQLEIAIGVLERPRLTVSAPTGSSETPRVFLATADAARDITAEVAGGDTIPVPLRGRALVAAGTGPGRWVHDFESPRTRGATIAVSLPTPPASVAAAAPPVVCVEARDASGAPVDGAAVSIEGSDWTLRATTDRDGRARFDAAAVVAHPRVTVRREGFLALHATRAWHPTIPMVWPATSVRVVVRGPDAAASPGLVVIIDGEPVAVDGGIAFVKGVPEGEHVAIVACAGWRPKIVTFEVAGAGDGTIEVTLREDS